MWTLTWGYSDTQDGSHQFSDDKEALAYIRKNWDPAEDIITNLRADGSWAECAGFGNEWIQLTENPDPANEDMTLA